MGNEIKFKPATFYLGIVDHLAKVVEGLKPEDMDAERGGDQDAEIGHGEILDTAPHGVAQRETKQAPAAEEGLTGFPPTKEPSGKGKDKDPGPATILDKNHHKATDAPLPAVVAVDTSTSPSTRKSDSHTSPPDNDQENRGPRIQAPFPHTKPYNGE